MILLDDENIFLPHHRASNFLAMEFKSVVCTAKIYAEIICPLLLYDFVVCFKLMLIQKYLLIHSLIHLFKNVF